MPAWNASDRFSHPQIAVRVTAGARRCFVSVSLLLLSSGSLLVIYPHGARLAWTQWLRCVTNDDCLSVSKDYQSGGIEVAVNSVASTDIYKLSLSRSSLSQNQSFAWSVDL